MANIVTDIIGDLFEWVLDVFSQWVVLVTGGTITAGIDVWQWWNQKSITFVTNAWLFAVFLIVVSFKDIVGRKEVVMRQKWQAGSDLFAIAEAGN